MKKFAIITDVTSDLDPQFCEEYDIFVMHGHLILPGGVDKVGKNSWEDFDREQFYVDLKKSPLSYGSSPANIDEVYAVYESFAKKDMDIISVSLSSGLSGTYNFTLKAKEELEKNYPNSKVYCIDSLRFGPCIGLMAIYASQLRKEGKSVEETVAFLENNKNRFHQMGWLDDLTFVARKGRLTHAKAFFGTLIGVKPIGEFDYNGLTTVLGKAKGEKKAYEIFLQYIKETIEEPENQIIFIAESNRRKQADEYKKLIEDTIHPKAVFVKTLFPSCTINVGPGLMAAYYYGKPISQDLSTERALVEKAING